MSDGFGFLVGHPILYCWHWRNRSQCTHVFESVRASSCLHSSTRTRSCMLRTLIGCGRERRYSYNVRHSPPLRAPHSATHPHPTSLLLALPHAPPLPPSCMQTAAHWQPHSAPWQLLWRCTSCVKGSRALPLRPPAPPCLVVWPGGRGTATRRLSCPRRTHPITRGGPVSWPLAWSSVLVRLSCYWDCWRAAGRPRVGPFFLH
jgi:hypothetical protein